MKLDYIKKIKNRDEIIKEFSSKYIEYVKRNFQKAKLLILFCQIVNLF